MRRRGSFLPDSMSGIGSGVKQARIALGGPGVAPTSGGGSSPAITSAATPAPAPAAARTPSVVPDHVPPARIPSELKPFGNSLWIARRAFDANVVGDRARGASGAGAAPHQHVDHVFRRLKFGCARLDDIEDTGGFGQRLGKSGLKQSPASGPERDLVPTRVRLGLESNFESANRPRRFRTRRPSFDQPETLRYPCTGRGCARSAARGPVSPRPRERP